MALTLFWRCEGVTFDATHDFSVGDNVAVLNGPPSCAINTTANMLYGTNGLDTPFFQDHATLDISSHDLLTPVQGSIGLMFRLTAGIANGNPILVCKGTGDEYVSVEITNNDELRFNIKHPSDFASSLITPDVNLQTNTIYFLVVRWHRPSAYRFLGVYNSSGVLINEKHDSTTFLIPNDILTVKIGDVSSQTPSLHSKSLFLSKYAFEPIDKNLLISSYTQYNSFPQDGRRQGGRFRHVQAPDTFQAEMTSLKAWYGEDLAAASWFDEDIVVAEGGAPASRLQRSNRYQLANLGR